jgi:hypothetical protein
MVSSDGIQLVARYWFKNIKHNSNGIINDWLS